MKRLFDILLLRLRTLFGRRRVERELDRELAFPSRTAGRGKHRPRNVRPRDAYAAAKRSLGGVAQIQEECRDMRRTNQIETIWNDLRYAVRTLAPDSRIHVDHRADAGAEHRREQRDFQRDSRRAAAAASVRASRSGWCAIYFQSDSQPKFPLNPNDFRDFRERNRTFESIAAMTRHDVQLSGNGADPVMLRGFTVTAGYFETLGVKPARGRDFTTDDELAERGRLAILSDHLWRSRFASDPNILGRTDHAQRRDVSPIVGVMPPDMQHPGNNFQAVADGDTVDLWMPFFLYGDPTDRGSHFLDTFGRLKPGVTAAQATPT